MIDAGGLPTHASTVKAESVRLLFIIAVANSYDILCGDIGNAFVMANAPEKMCCRAGPEFGERQGQMIEIIKALYGLKSSARAFHSHRSDSTRSMGFVPTRYDCDVWIKDRGGGTGYDHICTHVDNLLVVAKDPNQHMDLLATKHNLRDVGPPECHLGNSCRRLDNGKWVVSAGKHIKEAVRKIEEKVGTLRNERSPSATDYSHPELDDTPLLSDTAFRLARC